MFKGPQFDQSVVLLRAGHCRRPHGHYRWTLRYAPQLLERFTRRKRGVTGVCGEWMYLYRAIDCVADAVEFWFGEQRDLTSAKRFFRKGPGASWLRFQ